MKWTRGPTIGRGSTASVSVATTSSGELIAVKSTHRNPSLLQREHLIISRLSSSPYIITTLGYDTTFENSTNSYNLLLEYLPGGSLSDQTGKLHEKAIRSYTHQMLQGLRHIHGQGFVHCDIKGQNILLDEDRMRLKIADFGCAKRAGCATSAFRGTPAYVAPEVARGQEQGFAADVWALGCLVVEMGTGCNNLWPDVNDPVSVLYRIAYSDDVPEIPCWFSENAKDFVGRCLVRDSKERWSAAELLKHPFITGDDDSEDGEVVEVLRKSPTSVVNWRFSDDFEVFGSFDNMSRADQSTGLECLVGRIRSLVSCLSCVDWTEDEDDWVTVRCCEAYEEQSRNCEEDEHDIELSFAADDV